VTMGAAGATPMSVGIGSRTVAIVAGHCMLPLSDGAGSDPLDLPMLPPSRAAPERKPPTIK
jgi:hypothetical protein